MLNAVPIPNSTANSRFNYFFLYIRLLSHVRYPPKIKTN